MLVTLLAVVSLDGCLTRHNEPDMTSLGSAEDGASFRLFLSSCDAQICGRATYVAGRERELELLETGRSTRRRIVHTRNPQAYVEDVERADRGPNRGLLQFTDLSPTDVVAGLRSDGVQHVALLGGGQVYNAYLGAGVVDELRITIEARIFGTGVRLAGSTIPIDPAFELRDVERLGTNTLLLHLAKAPR